MNREIERRFIVSGTGWEDAPAIFLSQGYLVSSKDMTVRVRIAGEEAWLTIKGKTTGITRPEFEYAIPVDDAHKLLGMTHGGRVEKWRRSILFHGMCWEVDQFVGENAGLVMAEIELESETQAFVRPAWLGREVSHDPRYVNAALALRPYAAWDDNERMRP